VRSALLLASTAIFFVALRYLPVANATAIAFLSPLIVTALSVPLLGERVGPRRWAAVLVGFLGVLVVVRPGFGLQWPALLPALVATCLGLYQIATRVLARVDDTSTTIFHTAVVGTVASLIAIPFYWQAPTLPELALLILLGSLGAAGHMLIVHAYRYAGASVLSPFIYTQLVWATAGGYLIFDQFPDPVTLVGATLIIGSGLYVYLRERALLVAARQSG
jgi:drug/metabolite transporter (DMT)-like permease